MSSGKSFPDICSFSAALASKAPLMHQPGAKYTYSMGMDVLGCVIERASGQTFDVFLEERIFKPLQMDDTFSVPASKVDRFTSLYAYPGDLGRLIPEMKNKIPEDLLMIKIDDRSFSPYLKPATLFDGGSGLVSSAEDYLKFAQMLLNGGELAGERVLSRKSVELMSSNLLPDRIKGSDDYIPGAGFGITVGVIEDLLCLVNMDQKACIFGVALQQLSLGRSKRRIGCRCNDSIIGKPLANERNI